jgi:hypothetical protein
VGDRELVLQLEDRQAFERELDTNWAHGRAFVPGTVDLALFDRVQLVLLHPEHDARLEIACEVVMRLNQGPMQGAALQFLDRSTAQLEALRAFVFDLGAYTEGTDVDQPEADDIDDPLEPRPSMRTLSLASERQHKLRDLSLAERMKVARGPSLEDRVLLERIYGSAVWELLLRNPKITVPEVARMAKKGTMPRPLLDLIVENEAWIRQGIVRRALLSNPRLSPEGVARVLRTLPGRELRLIPHQTAYPAQVRAVAQRLMRGT